MNRLAAAGLELVRLVSCAGANTVRNPSRVTDVALRPPRRQSSLDMDSQRRHEAATPCQSWYSRVAITVSGRNWQLSCGELA